MNTILFRCKFCLPAIAALVAVSNRNPLNRFFRGANENSILYRIRRRLRNSTLISTCRIVIYRQLLLDTKVSYSKFFRTKSFKSIYSRSNLMFGNLSVLDAISMDVRLRFKIDCHRYEVRVPSILPFKTSSCKSKRARSSMSQVIFAINQSHGDPPTAEAFP